MTQFDRFGGKKNSPVTMGELWRTIQKLFNQPEELSGEQRTAKYTGKKTGESWLAWA